MPLFQKQLKPDINAYKPAIYIAKRFAILLLHPTKLIVQFSTIFFNSARKIARTITFKRMKCYE